MFENQGVTSRLFFDSLHVLSHSSSIHAVFWVIVIDVLSGYLKGLKTHNWTSTEGMRGLSTHCLVFFTLIIVNLYTHILNYDTVGAGINFFIFVHYLMSCAENFEALGVPFPDWIKQFFKNMENKK